MTSTTVVSAPGKVLVAGGYLVLDRQYTGLVIATSSRFYCAVRPRSSSTSSTSTSSSSSNLSAEIIVRAGQFPQEASTWTYTVMSTPEGLEVKASEEGRNKFVEITLRNALKVVVETWAGQEQSSISQAGSKLVERIQRDGGGLEVVVLADNDFYSQREQLKALGLPSKLSSLDSLPPFAKLPRPIHQTNKTGLGSSAALVTSLTAGILSHFSIISLTPDTSSSSRTAPKTSLDLVHNLSQFSHCLAQGKVGSGFDISSAVYGTHLYRRFSPSTLSSLMDDPSSPLLPHLHPQNWDHQALPFTLPKGLRLMLADVDAGTDTPSFVGKVLKWREENRLVADQLWGDLGIANESLGELLKSLAGLQEEEGYEAILRDAAGVPVEQCDIARPASQLLVRIRAALTLIRQYLQHMSKLSGVPIEPEEQTRLLDACSDIPGVLGGTVPGAGGYYAIVLLVVDTPEVVARVEEVWASWTEMSVCPLSARQSDGGLKREEMGGISGLKERLGW